MKIGHKPLNGAALEIAEIGAVTQSAGTGTDHQDIFVELFSELQLTFNPLSSIQGRILGYLIITFIHPAPFCRLYNNAIFLQRNIAGPYSILAPLYSLGVSVFCICANIVKYQ